MSEVLTGSPAGTIYGTFADGKAYIDAKFGDTYRAWEALAEPDQKRTLLSAAAFLDRQAWDEDYLDFADRDAEEAFRIASYELGVMIADDAEVIASYDAGSNLQSAYAGGAGVQFFEKTSAAAGTAPQLPPILQRLLGDYLASSTKPSYIGGSSGQSGACADPFASPFTGKRWPW